MSDTLVVSVVYTLFNLAGEVLHTLEGRASKDLLLAYEPYEDYLVQVGRYNKSGFTVSTSPRTPLKKYLINRGLIKEQPVPSIGGCIDALLHPTVTHILSHAEETQGLLPPSEVMALVKAIRAVEYLVKIQMGGVLS